MPARVREGIDVALFTDLQVLTPAAWLDFTAHIESMLAAGRRDSALVLWESVVEIFHVGSPSGAVLQSPTMPPLRRIPCTEVPCSRCERRLGGFRLPWVGTWTRRAVVVQTGATPQSAWDAYHANPATFDLLGLQMVRSQLDREAISPAHVDRLSTRLAYDRDGIPWSHAVAVFRIWQAGRCAWREPTRVGCPQAGQAELIQAGALLRHLLGATEIDEPFIPPYRLMCCCPTWSVCLSCDRSVCEDGCIWTFQCPLCMGSSSSE